MVRLCPTVLLLVSTALLAACASTATGPVSTGPQAECLVCKVNADLACVDVPINDDTPRTAHKDRTYYFCSDKCKAEFAKAPDRYTVAAK